MPRISPSLIRQAHRISPHAATLLPVCRDVPSALNEARWIREHVVHGRRQRPHANAEASVAANGWVMTPGLEDEIARLCRRRAKGEPLQYVLGTQPFGDLEMICRPGVLIPRPEPEAYTTYLATLITHSSPLLGDFLLPSSSSSPSLRILDLCTGTGCIALLLFSLLSRRCHQPIPVTIHGVDISPHAVALSHENKRHNGFSSSPHLTFTQGDIFSDQELLRLQRTPLSPGKDGRDDEMATSPSTSTSTSTSTLTTWDVLICNPPYISHHGFARQTARSVRNFEPKLAQVPPALHRITTSTAYPGDYEPEDVFYARLLDMSTRLRPKVMLFEVGDLEQAIRVARMALRRLRREEGGYVLMNLEIWRDWPDAAPEEDELTSVKVQVKPDRGESHDRRQEDEVEVHVRGSGHGRSVFLQCK